VPTVAMPPPPIMNPTTDNAAMAASTPGSPTGFHPAFSHATYTVRRKVLKLFGGAFHVYDAAENVIAYSKMKAFKLKEDIRLFTGEDMAQELLVIQARQAIDFGASYDVFDPRANQKVGALRRKGFKSILKDEWVVLDPSDRELGLIQEDSMALALVRRFVEAASLLLPQKYNVQLGGQPVATFKQNFNPFVYRLNVDLTLDARHLFDRRLALASALLMAAVEGKQG
jgi:hypothetical protein